MGGWTSARAGAVAAVLTLAPLGCGGGAEPAEVPAWDRRQPPASVVGQRRGLTPVRAVVHLHSPYSHDACDGEPRDPDSGAIDESCLNDLRAALCAARIDVAALSDHDDSFAEESWGPDLYLHRAGDELIMDGDDVVGSWLHCDDGHRTMIRVGSESALMPLFMEGHPEAADAEDRKDIYNGESSEAAAALRAAGATLWIPHTEQREAAWVRELGAEGLELFNIHAAIDPNIRRQHLGLDAGGAAEKALEFGRPDPDMPEPDLAGLAVMFENQPAHQVWTELLASGERIAVSAGSDAHQNALPLIMNDGERADSYRRMIRWASNIVLVGDPDDPAAVENALAAGRNILAYELFGTPSGFDVHVEHTGGFAELGDEIAAGDARRLVVTVPRVAGLWQGAPTPEIEVIVTRVIEGGAAEVARESGDVSLEVSGQPGAYHIRVTIVPHHLLPYLGWLADSYRDQAFTWVQTGAIYLH